MERLTTRARGLALMVDTGPCAVAGIVDRLASYEDTGLTPDEVKKHEAAYSDMQDKHDTLMRRWGEMVETIRRKVDAGTLTQEDRRLLDDLNLPHRYDKRNPTTHELSENPPLTVEELLEMDGEPVWCINGNGGQWGLVHVFSAEEETYVECVTKTGFTMDNMTYGAMGIYAWLAYRRKPEGNV